MSKIFPVRKEFSNCHSKGAPTKAAATTIFLNTLYTFTLRLAEDNFSPAVTHQTAFRASGLPEAAS